LNQIKNQMTNVWKYYERGKAYNNSLVPNQYNVVRTNTEFFIGNQWQNLPQTPAMSRLPKPTFNILKRVASLFIASLSSSAVTVRLEPLAHYDGSGMAGPDDDVAAFANASVNNLLEKLNFDYRLREALYDGVQTGDYCAHFYWDATAQPFGARLGPHRGEIGMELVDGINVMFGNPNEFDIQKQPYVIVVGRDTAMNLRREMEQFRRTRNGMASGTAATKSDESLVQADSESWDFAGVGGRTEAQADDDVGKVLYCYMYTKVQKEQEMIDPKTGLTVMEPELGPDGMPKYEEDANGLLIPKMVPAKETVTTVRVTKATRSTIIYEDVDTGLSLYPIAWGNWERQKNQYHGRALVTGLLPNQISINKLFASAIRHVDLMAFPKTVYNADLISSWNNEIGQAIGVHGIQPGQSIQQVAYNLQPSDMSNQVFALIDKAMAYTKECLGTTDAQMGNVKPENTSALMVLNTNAEVPLENIRAGEYEWLEDCCKVILDMQGTLYGKRPVIMSKVFKDLVIGEDGVPVIDPMTGRMKTQEVTYKVVEEFDFSQLKNVALSMKIDAGATTYFSEIAMTQTLDNLRRDGTLDVIQYLERLPDKLIPQKKELIDELRGRIAQGTQANAAAGAAIPEAGTPVSAGSDTAPAQGGPLSQDKMVQGLPTQMEQRFDELPNIAKKTALAMGNERASR
jgi:hypothetical protein